MLNSQITSLFDQLETGIAVMQASPDEKAGVELVYANDALKKILPASVSEISGVENLSAEGYHFQRQPIVLDEQAYDLYWLAPLERQRTLEETQTLSQAHRDFISTVSHEFRTPLTSIKGFADTLLNYGMQLDAEKQQRFIHIIRDQADRLIRLVEALLEVSKDGKARLDVAFRPVPLQPLLERVSQSIAIKSTIPHPFVVDAPKQLPPAWADADKLEQVLTNLVDNAVKYSEPNKTITLRAYESPGANPSDEGQERITIEIIDEGVGIAPAHLEKLFTQFYRIEGPLTQKVEGTGLGLYIVKSLVAAIGGSIEVTSEVGKGSVFRLQLPLATLERQAAYHRKRCLERDEASEEDTSYGG